MISIYDVSPADGLGEPIRVNYDSDTRMWECRRCGYMKPSAVCEHIAAVAPLRWAAGVVIERAEVEEIIR